MVPFKERGAKTYFFSRSSDKVHGQEQPSSYNTPLFRYYRFVVVVSFVVSVNMTGLRSYHQWDAYKLDLDSERECTNTKIGSPRPDGYALRSNSNQPPSPNH